MKRGEYVDELLEPLPENPTFMERVVRWLFVKDLMAAERLVLQHEARRLKIKTDLQEARLGAREAAASRFCLIATWRHHHKRMIKSERVSVTTLFYLEQNDAMRRVRGGPCIRRSDGQVIQAECEILAFETSQPVWTTVIHPWLDRSISTKALKRVGELEVVGE